MIVIRDKQKLNKLLQNIAMIAGVFAIILCILIIVNFIQWKRSDPLNSKALITLSEKLNENQGDQQLREQIRELDLLARKAYFTSAWQVRTGGILLFISVIVIIVCYQVIDLFEKKIPEKPVTVRDKIFFTRGKKRKTIMISGAVIILTAMIMAFFSVEKPAGVAAKETASVPASEQSLIKADTVTQGDSLASPSDSVTPTEGFATNAELRSNHPFFRGFGSNGVSFSKNVPVSWDGRSGKNILWKKKIPLPGYNSPILWNGKIYLSGASEKKKEVYCIDASTGNIEWTAPVENVPGSPAQQPKVNKETGYSAPSLATDGRRVYAIFANGDLVAVDFSGKIVWSKNMGSPKNHYGHSSSLITWHDVLIVQYDQSGNAFVAGLSGKTGDILWKTTRNVKISWASPVLVNTGKRTELILAADPFMAGYDPSTGKELWKLDCIGGEVGPSPVYANGIVFSVNEYSKLAAVKLGDQPQQLWEDSEYLSDVPSPVATDKYLFLSTSYGTVVCYDALTGEKKWIQEMGTNMYASPILAEGKIYQLDQKGVMHIFSAEGTYNLISKSDLGEGSFCTPAFADGRIFIRGDQNLYCIGK